MERAGRKAKTVSWRERDYLDGTVEAGVVIMPTRGCSWGLRSGCSMCGYVYDSPAVVDWDALLGDFTHALEELDGVPYLKVFNSGSFFDEREVPPEMRDRIIGLVNQAGPRRLQVESRPEFVTPEVLGETVDALDAELEVGIGLETASDYIRTHCINKGFSLEDFERALGSCQDTGAPVKAYLLVKPPFLTEREAVEDAVASARTACEMGASRVSFNPMNVQRGTLVEALWRRGEYRPPWLWSIVEILKRTAGEVEVPVLCHPTAAGKARGAHNCGTCDREIAGAVVEFSVTQDIKHLEGLECREMWQDVLELEGLGQTPGPMGFYVRGRGNGGNRWPVISGK
ncbi:MAG: archaeosine biosynthesis radical SAM protein RaSEA [Euryarchaeota archaeon]|nr:archaeosine biosynthesis radical SAM protein RaSEA [Euryarchaeota archaeon]